MASEKYISLSRERIKASLLFIFLIKHKCCNYYTAILKLEKWNCNRLNELEGNKMAIAFICVLIDKK